MHRLIQEAFLLNSRIGVGSCLVMAFLMATPNSHGQERGGTRRKPIVLVPPFENQTKQHENINYEVGTSNDPDKPKRVFKVDRYTEAPRTLFENVLTNMDGVTIVERQVD